jgi:hypothetical protein
VLVWAGVAIVLLTHRRTDVNKTGQIYDFFVKCGWVKSENATTTGTSMELVDHSVQGLTSLCFRLQFRHR